MTERVWLKHPGKLHVLECGHHKVIVAPVGKRGKTFYVKLDGNVIAPEVDKLDEALRIGERAIERD